MKKIAIILPILLLLSAVSARGEASDPRIRLETNHGVVIIELDPRGAPLTVKNFVQYVKDGSFDGTIFHRVIKGFMIQGGGLTVDMKKKSTNKPIQNEADNGLKNRRGTIAMARTQDPHSATSQFFINTADNNFLDHSGKNPKGWGYCVFGKVIDGLNVVNTIEGQPTTIRAGRRDVPVTPVVIKKAVLVEKEQTGSKN